jgi:hypothetical protein
MHDTKLHLGIEAGDVLLKVALFDPKEKKVIKTTVLETGTSPLDDVPSFETALQGWLAEDESIELDSVSLSVSSFRSIVRQVFVPPEATDVGEYLRWYLGSIVDADVEAYYLDFQIMNGEPSWFTVLLMPCAKYGLMPFVKDFGIKELPLKFWK